MISKQKAAFVKSLGDADGHIEPVNVVEAARDPSSPIHDEFEWDIRKAAQAHQIETARSLIKVVRLETVIETRTVIAPYYVTDPTRPAKSRRFVELTRLNADREIAERVVLDELDRIAAAIRRAQAVAAVLGLSAKLETMLLDVVSLRTKAERRAAAERARAERRAVVKSRGKRAMPVRGPRGKKKRA